MQCFANIHKLSFFFASKPSTKAFSTDSKTSSWDMFNHFVTSAELMLLFVISGCVIQIQKTRNEYSALIRLQLKVSAIFTLFRFLSNLHAKFSPTSCLELRTWKYCKHACTVAWWMCWMCKHGYIGEVAWQTMEKVLLDACGIRECKESGVCFCVYLCVCDYWISVAESRQVPPFLSPKSYISVCFNQISA